MTYIRTKQLSSISWQELHHLALENATMAMRLGEDDHVSGLLLDVAACLESDAANLFDIDGKPEDNYMHMQAECWARESYRIEQRTEEE